ncbi:MAG: carboxypeptidase-like regulatory domain-containing protein, partial [Coprothermobacterota bacterium]|nr:carboxypeptidase-like regulatory domain-containing protein [Coprothermobacterota bacterium]
SFTPNAFFTQVAQNAFNNTAGTYDFAGASPSTYSGSWPMLVGTFQWNALQGTSGNGVLVHFTSVLAQDASFNLIAVTPQDGTVVITSGGWALGTIGLESRPQAAWSGIRVVVDDNPALSATTGANGSYRIDGISPGSHTMKAYRSAFLTGVASFSIQTGQGTTVSGRLRGGDGNDDGSVNLTDLGLLANNFNLSAPQPLLALSSSAQSEITTTEDSPSSSPPSPSTEAAATLYFQPNPKSAGTGAFSWELYLNGATGMKQFEFHLSFDKAYLTGASFTPNVLHPQRLLHPGGPERLQQHGRNLRLRRRLPLHLQRQLADAGGNLPVELAAEPAGRGDCRFIHRCGCPRSRFQPDRRDSPGWNRPIKHLPSLFPLRRLEHDRRAPGTCESQPGGCLPCGMAALPLGCGTGQLP